jgi:hypothetical protein
VTVILDGSSAETLHPDGVCRAARAALLKEPD